MSYFYSKSTWTDIFLLIGLAYCFFIRTILASAAILPIILMAPSRPIESVNALEAVKIIFIFEVMLIFLIFLITSKLKQGSATLDARYILLMLYAFISVVFYMLYCVPIGPRIIGFE